MFNSLPTIRWSISPKRESRSKYQSSAMLSHFDIENTDLSPHDANDDCDCDPEDGRLGKGHSTGKGQITTSRSASASDSYQSADSQEHAIQRSVSFPEWIIGRWSSAFSSVSSSSGPCNDKDKDKDSGVSVPIAPNESMALLSLTEDTTSYGTTMKSKKNPPVTSSMTAATAATKKQTHQCSSSSDHLNSKSAVTTDAGDRAIVLTQQQQQQPKKDLLQYESFKDLAPRVGVRYVSTLPYLPQQLSTHRSLLRQTMSKQHIHAYIHIHIYVHSIQKPPPPKRRSSWGMFSVLRYSSSSMGRMSISSSISPEDENLVWEAGQPAAENRKRRFYSYDDMIQVDPAARSSRDHRPAASSSSSPPRSRSQSFTFPQQSSKPFTIHESSQSQEDHPFGTELNNASKSASFDCDCALNNNHHPSRNARDDVEVDDVYSDVDMSQCSSCDGSDDDSSSDEEEWDSLFPDEHIKTESTFDDDDHHSQQHQQQQQQRWHMKAYHKSRSVLGSIRALLSIKTYRYLLGVNTALYFTVTGVQFWGTKYLTVALNAPLPLVNALFILCAATVKSTCSSSSISMLLHV